jgi:hypothetical protein
VEVDPAFTEALQGGEGGEAAVDGDPRGFFPGETSFE